MILLYINAVYRNRPCRRPVAPTGAGEDPAGTMVRYGLATHDRRHSLVMTTQLTPTTNAMNGRPGVPLAYKLKNRE